MLLYANDLNRLSPVAFHLLFFWSPGHKASLLPLLYEVSSAVVLYKASLPYLQWVLKNLSTALAMLHVHTCRLVKIDVYRYYLIVLCLFAPLLFLIVISSKCWISSLLLQKVKDLRTSGPVTEDVISKGFLEHLKIRENSKKINKASAYNENEW